MFDIGLSETKYLQGIMEFPRLVFIIKCFYVIMPAGEQRRFKSSLNSHVKWDTLAHDVLHVTMHEQK